MHRSSVISVMNLVSDLDLPVFDYSAPDFSADRYHQQLSETGQQGWLAKSPLAYIVLDHDSGEFFLRSRATAFPGRQIAEFFGVTGGPLADHIDANILNLTGEQHRRLRALGTHRNDIERAVTEAQEYVIALLEAKRAAPGDGLTSELVSAPEKGEGEVGRRLPCA